MKNDCENCGKGQKERPSIFRNERWCSENCRKALVDKAVQEAEAFDAPQPPWNQCSEEFDYLDNAPPLRCEKPTDEEHDVHKGGAYQWRVLPSGFKRLLRPVADRPQA